MNPEIPKPEIPALYRSWIRCPYCGARYALSDNKAECKGVFVKCTRGCKREFEIKIHKGKQIK